jgi:hypothetical protein
MIVVNDLNYLLVSFIQRAGLPIDFCWQTSLFFPISASLAALSNPKVMATTHEPSYSSKAATTGRSSAGTSRAYIPCWRRWTIWPIASYLQQSDTLAAHGALLCTHYSPWRRAQFPQPTSNSRSALVADWPPHKNRMRAAKKGGGV